MEYIVRITEKSTGQIEEDMPCNSLRQAEQVLRGANINLNRAEFKAEILEVDDAPKE